MSRQDILTKFLSDLSLDIFLDYLGTAGYLENISSTSTR